MGVHLFDALRWFTGSEVEVIFAKVRDFAGDPNQRRSGLAEVVMRNGVIVQVLISFEMPSPGLGSQSQWTFIGSDGIVESDSYGKVRLGPRRRLGGRLRDAAVRPQRRRLQPGPAEGVRGADAAVRARRSRPAFAAADPALHGQDGRAAVEVVEAGARSSDSGEAVRLPIDPA